MGLLSAADSVYNTVPTPVQLRYHTVFGGFLACFSEEEEEEEKEEEEEEEEEDASLCSHPSCTAPRLPAGGRSFSCVMNAGLLFSFRCVVRCGVLG